MIFSSPFFLFFFLPTFLLLFYLAGKKYRDYILLCGSLLFYLWGEPIFCCIAVISAILDFWLGNKVFKHSSDKRKSKCYVALGVIANLSVLFYYKYTNFFFVGILHVLSGKNYVLLNVILPIGVSFIVFEKITYIVDIYRGVSRPAPSIFRYLNYVFLFPKLLAGPIIKYHDIEKQFANRTVDMENTIIGFKRFILGLVKKVFLADTLAEAVNPIFSLPSNNLNGHLAWLGMVCFTLQIYFDFSGYSDIAIGLARMLGFHLNENFNMPYISTSFTEFWRRWHISLSTWIREYLYIPLGGNRTSKARGYTNLWICFLLSGLWHGANWTFIAWGAYNGVFLVLDKLFWLKLSRTLPTIFCSLVTLFFIMLGWVIFRSTTFGQLHSYLIALLGFSDSSYAYVDFPPNIVVAIIIGSIIAMTPIIPYFNMLSTLYKNSAFPIYFESLLYGFLGFFAICKAFAVTFSPFLYFKF